MKVKALVAVRSGSVRVKNKNLRPFAGSSLLEVKVKQLMRIPNLDGVVVNSDDDQMLRIAKGLGCETVKRDPHYASNQVSMSEVYAYMAAQMEADVIAYINVTNPLLRDATLIDAIEKYKELAEEGINLSHCVGQYIDRVAGGECHILFLRRRGAPDRSLVTLQLSGKQICQAQGFNRRPITDQERRFLVQWGREKDIQIAV